MSTRKMSLDPNWVMALASIFALVISVATAFLTFQQNSRLVEIEQQVNLDPGELIVHRPMVFCIARGLRVHPSDHLILPIYIENTGHGAKTLDRPALGFTDPQTGRVTRFSLDSVIPELNHYEIGDSFEIARAVVIPEQSLERYVMVFHAENWWNPEAPDYTFRFVYEPDGANRIDMQFGYFEDASADPVFWRDKTGGRTFFSMPIYLSVNDIQLSPDIAGFVSALPNSAQYESILQSEQIGSYNSDCYSPGGLPSFPVS